MNCPKCHALIGAAANHCPACGVELETRNAGAAVDGDATVMISPGEGHRKGPGGTSRCPRCHGACRPDAAFCPTCGHVLGPLESSPALETRDSAKASPAPNRAARILIGLIIALAVFVVGSFAYVEFSMYSGKGGAGVARETPAAPVSQETLMPGARPDVVFGAPQAAPSAPVAEAGTPADAPASPPSAPVSEGAKAPVVADAEGQPKVKRRSAPTPRELELRREETIRMAEERKRREEQEAAEAQRKRAEQEETAKREAAAKPVDPRAAWQQACSGVSAFQRVFCIEKARWQHCQGKWDTTPECVSNN